MGIEANAELNPFASAARPAGASTPTCYRPWRD